MKPPTAAARGFTLIELMVGITILVIVLGIGVPSFTQTLRKNRLATQVNDFVTALNLARSEANKRGVRVTLCPSNSAQNDCSGATDWRTGWIAFTDATGSAGVVDTDDRILQVWPASGNEFTFTPNPSTLTNVGFRSLDAVAAASFSIYKSGCTGENKREVSVALTGRISLSKQAC